MKVSNKTRLALAVGIIAAFSFVAASWLAVVSHRASVRASLEQTLSLALDSRMIKLTQYATAVENDLELMAGTSVVQKTVQDLSRAFEALGDDPTAELQRIYIVENPNAVGSKQNLVRADDRSEYSRLHGIYHTWFKQLMEVRDFYDVMLVDDNGDIVYTVFKEDDLGTNLATGPYKDEPIADVYRKAVVATPGSVIASDFAPDGPSKGVPAAFEGTPIISDGRVVGALLVQLRLDRFDQIMSTTDHLGASGETYLVNADHLMLTQSRFVENSVFAQKIDGVPVDRALAGASGFGIIEDYRGALVLSTYRPFKWSGGTWAAIAEVDVAELDDTVATLRNNLLILGAVIVIVAGLAGWLLAARE